MTDLFKHFYFTLFMEHQLQLFEASKNPLEVRIGKNFFDELPKKPGVYVLYGRSGRVLYVGKAKNLRNRIFTYRRVTSSHSSRKTKRLVRMTHHIEITICKDEESALLEENGLIRKYRPEFNRAKKSPETYYYIVFTAETNKQQWTLHLSMHQPTDDAIFTSSTYGAFKGHRTVRCGVGALLRLLYAVEHDMERPFDFPGVLTSKLTPLRYILSAKRGLTLTSSFRKAVQSYLDGSSLRLFELLVDDISQRNLLNKPIGRMVLTDLESMRKFYDYCTNRNYSLINILSLPNKPIPQHKLDDYLIQAAFREKELDKEA